MEQKQNKKPFHPGRAMSINYIFLGALFALGMKTFIRACGPMEDGTFMHCHTAEQALFAVALVMTGCGILSLFISGTARKLIAAAEFALSIVGILLPGTFISLCMMPDMQCRAVMRPGATVFCILMLAAAAADLYLLFRRGSGDQANASKSQSGAQAKENSK